MKKSKILSIICAAVMVMGGVFAAGCKKEENIKIESNKETVSSDNVVIQEEESSAVSLATKKISFDEYAKYDVEPLAESAYTLTAVMTPSDASNKSVDWSVSWANSESGWAKGKNVLEYVKITPQADGGLIATLSCLQAFGEQIVITVVSRVNADLTATCTVDYAKKILSVDYQLYSYQKDVWTPIEEVLILGGATENGGLVCVPNVTLSVGTISDTFEYTHTFKVYDWVFERIQMLANVGGIDLGNSVLKTSFSKSKSGSSSFEMDMKDEIYKGGVDFVLNAYNLKNTFFTIKPFTSGGTISEKDFNTAYVSCVSENSELAYYEFTMTGTYSSYTGVFPVKFNQQGFYTGAESLSLSVSEVIF